MRGLHGFLDGMGFKTQVSSGGAHGNRGCFGSNSESFTPGVVSAMIGYFTTGISHVVVPFVPGKERHME